MIYFQYGARGINLLDRFIRDGIIDGIIWDPRFAGPKIIKQKQKKIKKNIKSIFDPKFYYYEYETPVLKKLEELSFNPNEKITRKYLNNQDKMEEYFKGVINYQLEIGTENIMTPSLIIETFDSANSERQLNIFDKFNDYCIKNNINKKKCINLTINENAFNNLNKMNEFIESLDELKNEFSDIYITLIREPEHRNKLNFNPNNLANILSFIYYLNYIGFKITMGYTGLEGILYVAVGATNIGTNVSQSLKRLVIDKIGLTSKINSQGGAQPKEHYTSLPLLNYLKCDVYLDQIMEHDKEKVFSLILSDCSLDSEIISGKKSFDYTLIDTQYQYMEALHKFLNSMSEMTNEAKIDYIIEYINIAIENTKKYNEIFKVANLPFDHLNEWKEALNTFKSKNIY